MSCNVPDKSHDGRSGTDLHEQLAGELRDVAPERIAVLCVGNVARGDDGFGPAVAQGLRGELQASLFDGGATPENDLPRIAALDPRVVLLVDAVHFGGAPGALRLLCADQLREDGVSTHACSLPVAAEFLAASCAARVMLLAAQPISVQFGHEMSPEMRGAVCEATSLLAELLGPNARGE